jgi:beta-galactosidase
MLKTYFKLSILLLFFLSVLSLQAQNVNKNSRIIRNFDNNWRFLKEDVKGAEVPSFDDLNWRKIDVPHDWSIEGPYSKDNLTGRGGGYLPAGIGWYRKNFIVNEAVAKQKFFIEFDGIMANSDVWINGFHLGKRPN